MEKNAHRFVQTDIVEVTRPVTTKMVGAKQDVNQDGTDPLVSKVSILFFIVFIF